MGFATLITAIIQLIILILKNKFEKDAEVKKQKEELHAQAWDAINKRDVGATISVLDKLHSK